MEELAKLPYSTAYLQMIILVRVAASITIVVAHNLFLYNEYGYSEITLITPINSKCNRNRLHFVQ